MDLEHQPQNCGDVLSSSCRNNDQIYVLSVPKGANFILKGGIVKKRMLLILVIFLFSSFLLSASLEKKNTQRFDTLLPPKTVDAIISHVSGDMAFQYIRKISQFHRYAASEGLHDASRYVVGEAKKNGLHEARIESFPADGKTLYYMWKSFEGWDAEFGELWIVEPFKEKLTSFAEVPVSLCRNSQSAEVKAELVYVGKGIAAEDYKGINVKNKIVLANGDPGAVHAEAVFNRGASGVVSYHSMRAIDYPDLVSTGGIWPYESNDGKRSTFGFTISHRKGEELKRILESGEKIVVEAKIKANLRPNKYYVVTATIPGTEPDAEEFLFVAHLCHYDPGSNDNGSGAASLLEISRAIKRLISSNEIEQPKRTIRFLWVPEMSGSYAYAAAHPENIKKTMCGINMDMVSSYLNDNNCAYYFHCTPHSLPHFINDVVANFADYVGKTNHEEDYYSAFKFFKPIISIAGSQDGFRYEIVPFMGGSDHKIFNDRLINVPMVFFNVWPDAYYHTNQDTPDKCDPTTLRRGAFIAAATALFVSSAKTEEALHLASEVYSNGLARIHKDMKKGYTYLNRSGVKELASAYKQADNLIYYAFLRERKALQSVLALDSKNPLVLKYIKELSDRMENHKKESSQDIWNHYEALCSLNSIKPASIKLSPEEKTAQSLIPIRDKNLKGPIGSKYLLAKLGVESRSDLPKVFMDERTSYEAFNFIDGKNSLLDIRNAISAELEPISLEEIKNFLDALAKAEVIEFKQPNIR